MKKYILFLFVVFCVANANAAGVILSDTSLPEEEVSGSSDSVETPSYSKQNYTEQQTSTSVVSLLSNDTSDPLFLLADNQFLSDTYINFPSEKMRIGQYIGYGINKDLSVSINTHYQVDFSGHRENGFSSTDIGGVYRLSNGLNKSRIISDVLFGLKAWGSSHVRTPEYADSSYYAGLRFGRQYTGVTFAGTVKSTWVFDDVRGLSYIDFIPEAYFRFKYDWRLGVGLDFVKSTNKYLLDNQEWLNFKLIRQYGNTQYVGNIGYEFDDASFLLGANVKILF